MTPETVDAIIAALTSIGLGGAFWQSRKSRIVALLKNEKYFVIKIGDNVSAISVSSFFSSYDKISNHGEKVVNILAICEDEQSALQKIFAA